MADCEFLKKCLFFNDQLKNMPVAAEGVKMMYCLWHYEDCGRYIVAKKMGPVNVPLDLFPPDAERAKKYLLDFNKLTSCHNQNPQ